MTEINKCTPDLFISNSKEYLSYFETYSNWEKVPLLNYDSEHYPDKALVRFRGMIQDMYNPEIYLESFEVSNVNGSKRVLTGKYKDINRCGENEQIDINSKTTVNGERQTLFVISVPGLNEWVSNQERSSNETGIEFPVMTSNNSENLKRQMDLDECENLPAPDSNSIENQPSRNSENIVANKNVCTGNIGDKVSLDYILNSPIPNKLSKACIVKIYDNFDKYKVNDIVDVIGFLSIDPALVSVGDVNICENQADNLPPSVVPRLHAVCVKPLIHCNPLLDRTITQFQAIDFEKAHKSLHTALTQMLFGDELASEYVIFHLLCRIFSRHDVTPIGCYNLNITNIPPISKMSNVKMYLEHLYNLLSSLVPMSHVISLTIEELNTAMFVPKKDYKTDRLVSGQLQLAKGTNLFIDEVSLEEGKLDQAGIGNLQALRSVIREQSIKYDFQYYHVNYECELPVLVLSEGRSILDICNQIPLEIDTSIRDNFEDIVPAVKRFLDVETLNLIRSYLTIMKFSDFEVSEDFHKVIENDFVSILREPGITPEDLHSYLTLARLYSLSRGHRHLSVESWSAVKQLEQKRRSRLASSKNSMEM